jgi:hypothetical protein
MRAHKRIPVVPGVVTTGQNNKAADIVRKRDEDARRKAIAKRKAIAAALAKRKAIAAALAKRKAAAALAKRKAALKRSTVAPVRTIWIRRH